AVEPRQAGPYDAPPRVDQRGDAGVADEREVEAAQAPPPARSTKAASQALTADESGSLQRAADSPSPTFTECPPMRLISAKPNSSVRSSPTKTGVRPLNGGSSMNSAIATPLSLPLGLSSTTIFPSCTSNAPPRSAARVRAASSTSARSP